MNKKNQILGVSAIVLSAAAFVLISQMAPAFALAEKDPGPRVFPAIAAGIIGIFGIVLLFSKSEETKKFLEKNQWGRLFLLYGIFLVYAVGIWLLGFLYPSILMLFVTCTLFSGKKKIPLWIRAAYAVLVSIIICYLFKTVFTVPMPKGILLK